MHSFEHLACVLNGICETLNLVGVGNISDIRDFITVTRSWDVAVLCGNEHLSFTHVLSFVV